MSKPWDRYPFNHVLWPRFRAHMVRLGYAEFGNEDLEALPGRWIDFLAGADAEKERIMEHLELVKKLSEKIANRNL